MQKQTRHALTVLLPLIFVMPVLLSCGGAGGGTTLDGGYLGNSITLAGSFQYTDKDGFEPGAGDGSLTFSMQGTPPVDLVTTNVTGASFSQTLSAPAAGMLSPWADVMTGLPSGSVSDASASGIVINTMVFHRTSPSVGDLPIYQANYEFTTLVFYVYTDKDVTSSASGTYTGPGGNGTEIMDMSMSLKAGWNRIIMTRTGPVGSFIDTWRVGDAPSDVYWAYGWS